MLELLTEEMQGEYQASVTPENWKRMLAQRGIGPDGGRTEGVEAA